MSASDLELVTDMPPAWRESSVVRHIGDPYSIEALAEEEKTLIDLGPVDMEACRGGDDLNLKPRGEEVRNLSKSPQGLIAAHELFVDAAKRILGQERYLDAEIDFSYRDNPVRPGGRQVGGRPHLDGTSSNMPGRRPLRLLGIACDTLPTTLLQGALHPGLFKPDGELESLRVLRRLRKEFAPTSRLILMPPALLHDATRDTSGTHAPVARLFMRWHLRV